MRLCLFLVALGAVSTSAAAQDRLTLADAVANARAANPAARAAIAAEAEAGTRVRQAQGAWLPRVDVVESVQRGNQPVYVFGSLLSQRRFTADHFSADALNHPAALTNHRAAVTIEQRLFSSEIQAGVRSAHIGRELATVSRDATDRDLAVAATVAYGRALGAMAALRASQAAVAAAEEDARRSRDRRGAGVVTEADVLELEVHLAQMKARAIEADADRRAYARFVEVAESHLKTFTYRLARTLLQSGSLAELAEDHPRLDREHPGDRGRGRAGVPPALIGPSAAAHRVLGLAADLQLASAFPDTLNATRRNTAVCSNALTRARQLM